MPTKSEVQDRWTDVKAAVCERWPAVGGEELDRARDSVGHVVGLIQQRTGESRDEIERYLNRIVNGRIWAARRIAQQSATEYPIVSVTAAFVLGCAAGALISIATLRRR